MMYLIVGIGFSLFFVTMAVGVMMGRKPLAGSCGGLGNVGLKEDGECKICGRTSGSCEEDDQSSTKTLKAPTLKVKDAMAEDNSDDEYIESLPKPADPFAF